MEVGTPEIRIEANGGLKLEHRSLEIALFTVCRAAAGVVTGVIRVEPDRLVIILDRAVVVAPAEISFAPKAVTNGGFRIEPDRLVTVLDRAVGVALAVMGRGCRPRSWPGPRGLRGQMPRSFQARARGVGRQSRGPARRSAQRRALDGS